MVRSSERPVLPPTDTAGSAVEPQETSAKSDLPSSPAHSDKSSDSEGRPVREKLKDTRIDALSSSDAVPSSDLPMSDAPNGNGAVVTRYEEQSPSGSESERGRLRRKRSREDFEEEQEAEKQAEKKERHARKKSRDVTSPQDSDADPLTKPTKTSISPIIENDVDETMISIDEPGKVQGATSDKKTGTAVSPKNKRTRDQTDKAELTIAAGLIDNDVAAVKTEEERTTKRPRDKSDPQPPVKNESKTKIPLTSGFANTSAASPFAAFASPSLISKATEKPKDDGQQASTDKFKSSGFGAFSSSAASPFGGLGNKSSTSPFATASGPKITSFASSKDTPTSTGGGFAALGSNSGQSAFGGASAAPVGGISVFGGALGSSSFAGFGGSKSSLPSFATPGQTAITGLSSKPATTFGTQQKDADSDEDEGSGGEDDATNDGNEETDAKFKLESGPVETGEEGESAAWVGRAKLYTMRGEGDVKGWKESGVGAFKFNVTDDEPKRARFVLRADGTHRLILNAAVPKTMVFGDPQGGKPGDGKLCFNTPTADGKVEMHLLKLRAERAVELYKIVKDIQDTML